MVKETVGKVIHDRYSTHQYEMELGEIQEAQFERYMKRLHELKEEGRKKYLNHNFFIEICPKKERSMPQILPRLIGHARASCPTPFLDQDVYMYNFKDDAIEFLWTLPSQDICRWLKDSALSLDQNQRDVLKFIFDYESGVLFRLMKILNKERPDSTLLEK